MFAVVSYTGVYKYLIYSHCMQVVIFFSVPFEIAPKRTPLMQLETSLVILTTALVISVAK